MRILKKLNIKKDLYNLIFGYLNDILGWEISQSDIKILSELYNTDYDMISSGSVKNYHDRMSILFSKETKDEIMSKLNLSYNTFNNSLSKLRKKGLINNNSINEKNLFNLSKKSFDFTITFVEETFYDEYKKQKSS